MNGKKIKFFWIYTIILFSVALVLILLSLAMTDYKKANETYENRVQMMQTETENLYKIKEEQEKTIAALEEKNRLLTESVEQNTTSMEAYATAVEKIYEADTLYGQGEYKKAKEVLDSVDKSILKERISTRYDYVKGKIDAKL